MGFGLSCKKVKWFVFGWFWVGLEMGFEMGFETGFEMGFTEPSSEQASRDSPTEDRQKWGVYRCPSLSRVKGTKVAAQG